MEYKQFSATIEAWFKLNQRPLPWREEADVYMVWLAEIVFQQTRIQQGLNHYMRIIEAYPSLEDLAQATEDDVLKLWEGLGYYSRARNLRKGAQQIAAMGQFPSSANEWKKISGVGPYTAAAIASVCYGEKVAVLDGNVMRVMARVFLIDKDIRLKSTHDEMISLLNRFVQHAEHPGNLNQGLMELGALVCVPKKPRCHECPIRNYCQLYLNNESVAHFPFKSPAAKKIERHIHWVLASNSSYIMLRKRLENDVWKGLYELPQVQNSPTEPYPHAQLIHEGTHILSHQKIFYHIWDIGKWSLLSDEFQAFDVEEGLPALPRPLQRFFEKMSKD